MRGCLWRHMPSPDALHERGGRCWPPLRHLEGCRRSSWQLKGHLWAPSPKEIGRLPVVTPPHTNRHAPTTHHKLHRQLTHARSRHMRTQAHACMATCSFLQPPAPSICRRRCAAADAQKQWQKRFPRCARCEFDLAVVEWNSHHAVYMGSPGNSITVGMPEASEGGNRSLTTVDQRE